ncbi:MAG: hypothetical protein HOE90_21115 [Bacteriovoracaceae bacterium]|nr:hypothetical protein [Bacteriovoracaceae bacterium]
MKIPYKLIFQEMRGSKKFTLLFILNLGLGLAGFISLNSFRESINFSLKSQSKNILGADFGVSARRPITSIERELIKSTAESKVVESEMVELFTMIRGANKQSRLVQLKAISSPYPFYGALGLDDDKKINGSEIDELYQKNVVWVYPELLLQLGLKKGESIQVGEAQFTISQVVSSDSAAGFSTSMAPRMYISLEHLGRTKLLRAGSLAWYSYVYQIPGKSAAELGEMQKEVFDSVPSNDLQVYSYEEVNEQTGRLMNYLSDFLGLSSLAALFLAAVGAGFLYKSYLEEKTNQVAVLLSLGISKNQAFFLYNLQLVVLGAFSALLALTVSVGVSPLIGIVLKDLFPYVITFNISTSSIVVTILLGTLGSCTICFPQLRGLKKLSPTILLDSFESPQAKSDLYSYLSYLPAVVSFYLLSIYQSRSLIVGSLFCALFFGSVIVLTYVSPKVFHWLESFSKHRWKSFSWAMRDLARHRLATTSSFLALALGMLLLNLIPQIEASLQHELEGPADSKLPSLFLFDIQEEQVSDIIKIAQKDFGGLHNLSPMVRAKLVEVNDLPFEKGSLKEKALTREEQRERRFRNRGVNLSYKKSLGNGEKITNGRPFSGDWDESSGKLPEISLETRYASRLGLKIGDKLTFDVQSIMVSGEVINIRKVKWTTFSPNFFIQFQPGVLEPAPKTFLASTRNLSTQAKNDFQLAVLEGHSNVSMVDVTRLASRIQLIIERMGVALNLMATLCFIVGFVVVFSISTQQARAKIWDVALYKALGADFKKIRSIFIWQFTILSLLASLGGISLGILISLGLSSVLFESYWAINTTLPIISTILCCFITVIVSTLSTQSALKSDAASLLN